VEATIARPVDSSPAGEAGAARDRGARGTPTAATGGETQLHGRRVVLATGSRPLRPASVPFEDPWAFDSEEVMELGERRRDVLIVGGGPVGVEDASIFSALGVPVTILDAAPRLVVMMDQEMSRRLATVFVERGVEVVSGTGMASAERRGGPPGGAGRRAGAAPGRPAVRRRTQRRHR
jgi:pyruvate/2-oxoglutarate dehydrogenase complex dihydrolipoamide dehydrogenase (E3) component